MGQTLWRFILSDAGLMVRIALGTVILGTLAWADWRRHGPSAQRWREYAFLLAVVAMALLYGVVNDQVTSRISWEYFYYGKDLAKALGDQVPPDELALSWEAAKVGLKATWSAGLIIGVVLLIANNPRPGWGRLRYPALVRMAFWIMLCAAGLAAVMGLAGYASWLAPFSDDFRQMLARDEMRPRRFMAVFGIHLGGYLGALLGVGIAVWRIIHARRRGEMSAKTKPGDADRRALGLLK